MPQKGLLPPPVGGETCVHAGRWGCPADAVEPRERALGLLSVHAHRVENKGKKNSHLRTAAVSGPGHSQQSHSPLRQAVPSRFTGEQSFPISQVPKDTRLMSSKAPFKRSLIPLIPHYAPFFLKEN